MSKMDRKGMGHGAEGHGAWGRRAWGMGHGAQTSKIKLL